LNTVNQFLYDHWGDVASVVGVIVSLIGFIITIIGVVGSKRAAKRAEDAAVEARAKILWTDTIMELSSAIAVMDEIKRLHRVGAWSQLPDRYSYLKRLLISIRSSNPDLVEGYRTTLQSAIQHFTDIEKKVERALVNDSAPTGVAKLNTIVSSQLDQINEVLAALRQEIGIEKYGRPKALNSTEETE
jgi:hypothetical protein